MSDILVPTLYALVGFCAYAGGNHWFIAMRRPVDKMHLLFSLMCLALALLVFFKASAYGATSAENLVDMRRFDVTSAALFLMLFPWFIGEYTGVRPRWMRAGLSSWFALAIFANFALPHGLGFTGLPELAYLTLPWGERVVDLRPLSPSPWLNAAWLGIVTAFGYAVYAAVRQYRNGARRRARALGLALLFFVPLTLFNHVVNHGLVQFVHTAEFGFVALILVMNYELVHERRRQQRRMQALLDNVPGAVYMKSLDGRYVLSNRRHEALLGAVPGGVVGKTDHDLFPVEKAEALRANDRVVAENRQPQISEEVTEVQGEPRTYVSHKFVQVDDDGVVSGVCGISIDVTESRTAEEAMDMLRRQVWHADRVERTGALAASLAHELSQPLTAVLCNAQAALRFLADDNPDLDEVRESLRDIVRDDKRATGVIHGLRAMLRRQDTPREPIDLSDCVEEVLDLMHSEFLERVIDLRRSLAPGITVIADRSQVQQVMLNLLMNACEAMAEIPEGERRLWVSVSEGKEHALVAVRDGGTGLTDDQLELVFSGFYTTKPHGHGIGLPVCRSIVESHGGKIRVTQNEDKGVTFSFTLPCGRAGTLPGADGAHAPQVPPRERTAAAQERDQARPPA